MLTENKIFFVLMVFGVNQDIFSIIPRTGTFIFSILNIAIAFLASAKATGCGVVTTTTPVRGRFWTIDRCTSPVPISVNN